MHHQARRLVDHQQRLVLVHHAQLDRFGRDARMRRQIPPAPALARHRPGAGARSTWRPPSSTAPAPIQRCRRAREYCGRAAASADVEALPGRGGGQFELVDTELGGHVGVAGAADAIRYTGGLASLGYIVTVSTGFDHSYSRVAGALAAVLLMLGTATVGGCHSNKPKTPHYVSASSLYHDARKALDNNDYETAVKQYEALTSRFPFSDETRQARLDLICVYYRKGEKEAATDAAEQFLRENPTNPRVDYAWYMKGLIDYEDTPWAIERWLGVDPAKRPPAALTSAITAFSTVVKQYPKSEYAQDAQLRLIYLRNRLAEYEINVARYYMQARRLCRRRARAPST